MTDPVADYTAQHRVIALQAAVALAQFRLGTPIESIKEVLADAETLLAYLTDGTLPA